MIVDWSAGDISVVLAWGSRRKGEGASQLREKRKWGRKRGPLKTSETAGILQPNAPVPDFSFEPLYSPSKGSAGQPMTSDGVHGLRSDLWIDWASFQQDLFMTFCGYVSWFLRCFAAFQTTLVWGQGGVYFILWEAEPAWFVPWQLLTPWFLTSTF